MNMEEIKEKLSGVFPPMMTPFKADQTLDEDAVAFNTQLYAKSGIRGLMPLGSNGEFKSLTEAESLKVVRLVKDNLGPHKTLMVGTGRESAYATVEFTKKVADQGADFVSLLTPFYFKNKMTDEALIRHFTYVADNSPVPVLLYCAPKFAAGLLISPDVVRTLADHPNIVGMKDTSGEHISVYTEATKDKDFYVLAGSINKYMDALECGGIGGVLSAANYLPDECSKIKPLFDAGKVDEAKKLCQEIKELSTACSGSTGIPGSKACMTLMGFKGGDPRLPLLPINDEQREAAANELRKAGYLK
jgi:4-hydroxy-2-oxoglutarate aldolase